MLQEEFTPLEIDEESLAFDAHQEVGPRRPLPRRGAHAGALPRLLLPAAAVVDRELRALGAQRRRATPPTAPARSGARRSTTYEPPPLDDAIRRELDGVRRTAAGASSGTRTEGSCDSAGAGTGRLGTETAFEVLARAKALEAQAAEHHPPRDRRARLRHAAAHRRGGRARRCATATRTTARRPGLPELREACAEHLSRAPRPRDRPGTGAGRAGREAVPLLRRARDVRPRRRGDLPEPGLPDLRVGDPLGGRDAGAASAHRGERASRSRPTTWPSGSRRGRGS